MARKRTRKRGAAGPRSDRRSEAPPGPEAQSRYGNEFLQDLVRQGQAPSGGPVPHREQMESAFGQDLSGVRATFGNPALGALGMRAAASGDQVHFADNNPSPELVGHELAHVMQGRQRGGGRGRTSRPGDAAERDADRAGADAAKGRPAAVTAAPTGEVHASWLSDLGDAIGDFFDIRENEAAWDEWEDFQDAMEEREAFEAESHEVEDFQSTTKIGMFDAAYDAASGVLNITVRCSFSFLNGSTADYPGSTEADVTWAEDAKETWKTSWLTQCNTTWSGNHTFYCQQDWWEDMSATVAVHFVESDDSPHYNMEIMKIPTGEFRQSSVGTGKPGGLFGWGRKAGHGTYDSEDLTPTRKPGGTQIGAVHEAGHMLGLDDEYGDDAADGIPGHSGMVKEALGHGVSRSADDRIMSGGMSVKPEHGVTFLAALIYATERMWSFRRATFRPRPIDPRLIGVGDFPTPDPNGPHYA